MTVNTIDPYTSMWYAPRNSPGGTMNPQWLRTIGHAIWNRVLRVTATSFLLYASLSTAFPQALTSLSGDVTDATGALVPNVAITLEDKSRGLTRSTTSDAVGLYTFPQVPP